MKTSDRKEFKITKSIDIVAYYYETKSSWGHIAELWKDGSMIGRAKARYYNRTWERYTYESVMYELVEKDKVMTPEEKKIAQQFIKDYTPENPFKSVAAVAMMGELLCDSQQAKNDWKVRMLKAGIGEGLDMPDDWATLPEDEKETRLNKVIEELGK